MENKYQKLQEVLAQFPLLKSPVLFGTKESPNDALLGYFSDFITALEMESQAILPETVNTGKFLSFLKSKLGEDSAEFKKIKDALESHNSTKMPGGINDNETDHTRHTLSLFALGLKDAGVFQSGASPTNLYKSALGEMSTALGDQKSAHSDQNTAKAQQTPTKKSTEAQGSTDEKTPDGKDEVKVNVKNEHKESAEQNLSVESDEEESVSGKVQEPNPQKIVSEAPTPAPSEDPTEVSEAPKAPKAPKEPSTLSPTTVDTPAVAKSDNANTPDDSLSPENKTNELNSPAFAGSSAPRDVEASSDVEDPNTPKAPPADVAMLMPGKSMRVVNIPTSSNRKKPEVLRKRESNVNRNTGFSPQNDNQQFANNVSRPSPREERRSNRKKKQGGLPGTMAKVGAGAGAGGSYMLLDSFAQSIQSSDASFIIDTILNFLA